MKKVNFTEMKNGKKKLLIERDLVRIFVFFMPRCQCIALRWRSLELNGGISCLLVKIIVILAVLYVHLKHTTQRALLYVKEDKLLETNEA